MKISFRALVLSAAGVLLAGCGSTYGSSPGSSSASESTSGSGSPTTLSVTDGHLVGAGGKAVYLWEKDTGTTSMCSGGCASAWPPLTAMAVPTVSAPLVQSKVGLSKRADGTEQVTYGGHPLYYFSGDAGAGDTYGQGSDGFGAKWWLVTAAGSATMTAATASSMPSSGGGYGY